MHCRRCTCIHRLEKQLSEQFTYLWCVVSSCNASYSGGCDSMGWWHPVCRRRLSHTSAHLFDEPIFGLLVSPVEKLDRRKTKLEQGFERRTHLLGGRTCDITVDIRDELGQRGRDRAHLRLVIRHATSRD